MHKLIHKNHLALAALLCSMFFVGSCTIDTAVADSNGSDAYTQTYEICREFTKNVRTHYDAINKSLLRNTKAELDAAIQNDYFATLQVSMPDGSQPFLYELPDTIQSAFLDQWEPAYAELLADKAIQIPEVLDSLHQRNKAFAQAQGHLSSKNMSPQDKNTLFTKTYSSELTRLAAANLRAPVVQLQSRSALTPEQALTYLKSKYARGRILHVPAGSGGSSADDWGHTAMIQASWNTVWDQYPDHKTDNVWKANKMCGTPFTIAAWGFQTTDHSYWIIDNVDGKQCVQDEPVGYWIGLKGTVSNRPTHANVLRVRNIVWTWPFVKISNYPSPAETEKAIAYAVSKKGVRFAKDWFEVMDAINSEQYFQCASLMFHAWKNVDSKYRLSASFLNWIYPDDLAACEDIEAIGGWDNELE